MTVSVSGRNQPIDLPRGPGRSEHILPANVYLALFVDTEAEDVIVESSVRARCYAQLADRPQAAGALARGEQSSIGREKPFAEIAEYVHPLQLLDAVAAVNVTPDHSDANAARLCGIRVLDDRIAQRRAIRLRARTTLRLDPVVLGVETMRAF